MSDAKPSHPERDALRSVIAANAAPVTLGALRRVLREELKTA